MKIGTSCKGCAFAEIGFNDEQSRCSLDILYNISNECSLLEMVDGYYQFDRVCLSRVEEPVSTTEEAMSLIKKVPINVIINHSSLENTSEILKKLLTQDLCVNVVIGTNTDFDQLKQMIDGFPKPSKICLVFEDVEVEDLLRESFKSASNGYTLLALEPSDVDSNRLTSIDEFVRIYMKRCALIYNKGPLVFNNVLFRFLKGDKESSFMDKILERAGTKMMFSWEDVYETVGN